MTTMAEKYQVYARDLHEKYAHHLIYKFDKKAKMAILAN